MLLSLILIFSVFMVIPDSVSGTDPEEPEMQIFVNTMLGDIITLEVSSGDNISVVKEKIQDELDVTPDEQELFYAGELLEDDCTLGEYNIQNEATLYLIYRLSGITYIDEYGDTQTANDVTVITSDTNALPDVR